jgi:hypothetical protein
MMTTIGWQAHIVPGLVGILDTARAPDCPHRRHEWHELTGTLTVHLATGAQSVSLTGAGSTFGSLPPALSLSPSPMTFNNGYTIGDNPYQIMTVTNPPSQF